MIDRVAFVLLALLVFAIPLEKSLGPLTKVLGAAAFVAGIAAVAVRRSARALNLSLVAAALFVAWSATTILWSADRSASLTKTVTLVQLLGMMWLIWQLCRTAFDQRVLMACYVGAAAVACLFTVARYAASLQTNYRRYAPPGFDPNDMGVALALAIPMGLYLAAKSTGLFAWGWRASVALCCTAVLLTASRTALVAAAVAFVFALWTWKSSTLLQRWAGIALFAGLCLGTFVLAPKESRTRIATIGAELTRGTLHNRTTIWKAGLTIFKAKPLGGVGTGAYPDAVRPLIGVPGRPGHEYVAHNTFLSVLAETGLIGFTFFAALLCVLALFVWAMPPKEMALWAVTLGVWAVGVSTLTWEHRKPGWLIFGLVATEWARSFETERKD